jgi:iron-sulfur cluster repair protein YtfE (RIC family)
MKTTTTEPREGEKAMTTAMAPLRAEHQELRPYIEQLRVVADEIGELNAAAIRTQVDELLEFLTLHLIPHARAEDDVLYPAVASLMGSSAATRTMSRDHVAVVRLVDELGATRTALRGDAPAAALNALRRILYGLYALVTTHFAKEEEIYLPLLEARLSLDEAAELLAGMERSASRAKALVA